MGESGQLKYWERKEAASVFALFLDAFVWFSVRYTPSTFHCNCGSFHPVFAGFFLIQREANESCEAFDVPSVL